MIRTSETWRQETRENIRQAAGLAAISIGVFDATAAPDAQVEIPEPLWAGGSVLDDGLPVCYAVYEPAFFRLDRRQLLLPKEWGAMQSQRFVGNAQADGIGLFKQAQEIEITFGGKHDLAGLTLDFGTLDEEAPVRLEIEALRDGAVAASQTADSPGAQLRVELAMQQVDGVRLRFARLRPYGRARLARVRFGLGYEYGNAEILRITATQSRSPVSMELPGDRLRFSLRNENGRFDIESPSALVQFLAEGQTVTVRYGFALENGAEWVPGGVWRLQEWTVDGGEAQFTAAGPLAALNDVQYETGEYYRLAHNARELAADVLRTAGLSEEQWYLDPYLERVQVTAPLPVASCAQVLQLLANRCRAQLFSGRDGRVCIEATVQAEFAAESSAQQPPFSDAATLGQEGNAVYAAFEPSFFRLDKQQLLLPASGGTQPAGWTALTPADGEGALSGALVLLQYEAPTNVYSLEIDWGGAPPVQARAICRVDGRWQYPGVTLLPTAGRERYGVAFVHCDAVEIEVQRCLPGRRARMRRVQAGRMTDFVLGKEQIFEGMEGAMLPRLRCVTGSWTGWHYDPGDTPEEVAKVQLEADGEWARVEHDPFADLSATAAGAALEQQHGAYVSRIRATGGKAAEAVLKGVRLGQTPHPVQACAYDSGEQLPVDNPLFAAADTTDVLEWIRDFYMRRLEYKLEVRGFPELEPGDWIELWDGRGAQITAAELTFHGGFRQTLTLRV